MKTPRWTVSVAILAASVAVIPGCSKERTHHWGYTGETGPAHWGQLSPEFATCASGQKQSPIDIVNATDVDLPPLEVHYGGRTTEMVNNGHTIQVDVEQGNSIVADGKRWNLTQFHFHSPSEHHVRGESFPLEAHFVHRNEAGNLAVVALLFREGPTDPALESIASRLPRKAEERAAVTVGVTELGPRTDSLAHYHYDGSLTTPPCSEGTRWYVLQTTKSLSSQQAAAFRDLFGSNARTIQPLNGRQILQ